MGLDTFASRSPHDIELNDEDLQAFREANIELRGGIFSGGGNDGSFRGKVYTTLILDLTGFSLYQEWFPPETVHLIFQALLACLPKEKAPPSHENNDNEVLELIKFFKVCSERRLGLINWW